MRGLVLLTVLIMILPLAQGAGKTVLPQSQSFMFTVIYYGWLDYSTLQYMEPDMLVFAGSSHNMGLMSYLGSLRNAGTILYAYIHDSSDDPVGMGGSFSDNVVNGGWTVDQWVSWVEGIIDAYVGKVDGVFLDECDPGYFTSSPSGDDPLVQEFSNGLSQIVAYAHSQGLGVFINGVRAYASYGDYYLWEDFIGSFTGDASNPNYYQVTDFFLSHEGDDNPYQWVNDYAKYEYLLDNGLLSRTIAVTYGPFPDPELQRVAYYSARILGMGGWSYANADHYASTQGPSPVEAYELGEAVHAGYVDPSTGTLRGEFTGGIVEVQVSDTGWTTMLEHLSNEPPDLDYDSYTSATDETDIENGLDIVGYLVVSDGMYPQLEIVLQAPFSGAAIHVFIDSDEDPGTGYQYLDIGADYMLEITSSAQLFNYSGSGTDWSWDSLASPTVTQLSDERILVVLPLYLEGGFTAYIQTVDSSWTEADHEPDSGPVQAPGISDSPVPIYGIRHLTATLGDYNRITYEDLEGNALYLYAFGESGSWSEFVVFTPTRVISGYQEEPNGANRVDLTEFSSLSELESSTAPGYYQEPDLGLYKVYVKLGPHSSQLNGVLQLQGQALGGLEVPGERNDLLLTIIVLALSTAILLSLRRRS